jgi:hypothetical protein
MSELLKVKKLFYDTKQGLVSFNKFYDKIKENNINITKKQAEEFYKNQEVNQVLKPINRPKIYNSIVANFPRDIFQMDIMIYDRYEYRHYKYILVIIDVYSRYMMAKPMTNRRNETILENVEDIFKDIGIPRTIQCDNEFNTNNFNQFLKDNDIYVNYSDANLKIKNQIVERVNRTIALQLQKIRLTTGRNDWYNYIDDVIYNYNRTKHKTIKNKPIDIFNGKEYNQQNIMNFEPSFIVGDKVRIKKEKKLFDKGDILTYSKEIYIIKEVKGKKYLLSDDKYYKPEQIKKVGEVEFLEKPVVEPETKTEQKTLKNKLRRDGIELNNIIRTSRRSEIRR